LGEESGWGGDSEESSSALENASASGACSNVASGPTAAELLELVDAAIIALDAGETESHQPRQSGSSVTPGMNMAFERI
jgi:hypothetical protein